MAFVVKNSTGKIIAYYGSPQVQPLPEGYCEISDDDVDLLAFLASATVVEPTIESLTSQLAIISAQITALQAKG